MDSTAHQTIGETLKRAATELSRIDGASPRLEAELLLCHVLAKPRSHLFAWPDREMATAETGAFARLLARRLQGEPLAYITGQREFWSLTLEVTPDTLIPRPETEILVEQALAILPAKTHCRVADLGTGSGAIAAAIASERPLSEIFATDSSPGALAVARRNFERLSLGNVHSLHGEWCTPLPQGEGFDLIVSNPPYVEEGDPYLEKNGLPWEPQQALVSGADGLDDIRLIIDQARNRLKAGGWLLLEHGFDQAGKIRRLLHEAGYRECDSWRDLAHHERVTGGIRP
jgi:release factor glutamine methyltransferase